MTLSLFSEVLCNYPGANRGESISIGVLLHHPFYCGVIRRVFFCHLTSFDAFNGVSSPSSNQLVQTQMQEVNYERLS